MPRPVAIRSEDLAEEIRRYRHNWVHQVIEVGEQLRRRVIGRLESEGGYERVRFSLGPFISLVWREPRPLTELAQQLSISRQACSKIARLAEQDGYVEIARKEGDRALRVRLTKRGRSLVDDGVRFLVEEEASLSERIGSDRLARLNAATSSLFFGLGLQNQTDASLGEAARRTVGVLPLVANRIEVELLERIHAKGHEKLQSSHARLVALLGDTDMNVSEIARLQGVSRQAIGATVNGLESLGYVRREPHVADGRALHVRLTERGAELIRDSLEALEELEDELREMTGVRCLADFIELAALLHRAQRVEVELFEAPGFVSRANSDPKTEPKDRDLLSIAALLERRLGGDAATRLGRLLCESQSPSYEGTP